MWKRATHEARTKNVLRWLEQIPFMQHTGTRDEPLGIYETDRRDDVWRNMKSPRHQRFCCGMVCIVRRITYTWDDEGSIEIIWKNGWSYRKLRDVYTEEVLNAAE